MSNKKKLSKLCKIILSFSILIGLSCWWTIVIISGGTAIASKEFGVWGSKAEYKWYYFPKTFIKKCVISSFGSFGSANKQKEILRYYTRPDGKQLKEVISGWTYYMKYSSYMDLYNYYKNNPYRDFEYINKNDYNHYIKQHNEMTRLKKYFFDNMDGIGDEYDIKNVIERLEGGKVIIYLAKSSYIFLEFLSYCAIGFLSVWCLFFLIKYIFYILIFKLLIMKWISWIKK